ncbi:MAG TPA: CPXCG motif-containing cysteine-rich protein [Gammaproteobacteria bacterium]|nr:CPXCG motif-containing cysteine-rich protein [Gammaproteobacteria bacterium]
MDGTELVEIQCPYCGETIEVVVDCSVENQHYIEDCQVCCRPMNLAVAIDAEGIPVIEVSQEDDA